jgi:hypothetical protein
MSQQGKGTITTNDLMAKLVQAKKVMNKVDSGNFERGNINETILKSAPEDLDMSKIQPKETNVSSQKPLSVNKIQNSKLPDAIKRAMIENPIPQISLNDTLDMDFVQGAKRLMEQEGVASKKSKSNIQVSTSSIDMNAIAVLIENTVRKVMDEKLNQILTAQQTSSINENLVLKVGDSIFKGKITGVNKAK